MPIEDYFDFLAPNDIRLKGTRIGIETVLYEYLLRGKTAEAIAEQWRHALTLEQVYATILFYHHERDKVHQYMTDWLEWGRRMRREQAENPPPGLLRLRELRKAWNATRRCQIEAELARLQ